ncbi:putative quinol monooxygenase [Bradyrhizobium tropiciagri]|uniref:putative quinol monooxygenase n=1 Tax=Bradyrhizobium tropiciagri TaxID=312253 RepID=UPI0032DF7366
MGHFGELRGDGHGCSPVNSERNPPGAETLHDAPSRRFDANRTVHDIDNSIIAELKPRSDRLSPALRFGAARQLEKIMKRSEVATTMSTRRSAIGTFAAIMAIANVSPWAVSQSRAQQSNGGIGMKHYAMSTRTISDAINTGGLLVVAQWEAKEGQADRIAEILDGFLPEAQKDPGAKLFLIGRGKDNPAQFLFYELFRDEAALKAHQESAYFKTYIAEQALPLLAKRERAQYVLI